jgi:trimeric autotransporter adhesin
VRWPRTRLPHTHTLLHTLMATCASAFGQTATTTSLVVNSGGNQVSTVSAASMITLTASVAAASATVKQGQVIFCDATALYCTDIHLLGTVQLNNSGKAQMYLRPRVGSYSYKAIFLGTPKTAVPYAGSVSSSSSLTVTGQAPTGTTIAQSGSSGDYTLTATALGFAKSPTLPTPTGSISFVDTTNNNSSLGMASLTPVSGPGWINIINPIVGNEPGAVVAGDFNRPERDQHRDVYRDRY